jgi:hypothetical protein
MFLGRYLSHIWMYLLLFGLCGVCTLRDIEDSLMTIVFLHSSVFIVSSSVFNAII